MTNPYLEYSIATLKSLEKKYKEDTKDPEMSNSVRKMAAVKLNLVKEAMKTK